jgi:cytidylate kinase
MKAVDREPVITIDGPAGAGKSTAARMLAGRLRYELLDTGAMYRALAWSVLRAGLPLAETPELGRHLASLDVTLRGDRVYLNGRDVTPEIRTLEVGEATSRLTMLAPIREKVTPLQRAMAARGGVVLEGRDTGTVVCPDAEVKFFLDASLDARTRRRHAELAEQGMALSLEQVREEIIRRDAQDRGRALAPLRKAPDAIEVDTSDLTAEQVVDVMLRAVERQCCTRS